MTGREETNVTLKSAADIEKMDAAGRVVEEVLNLLERAAQVGVATEELDELAAAHIKSRGAGASFLGYHGYPRSICTSVNSAVVHGIPGKYRLKSGDIISCDVGAYLDGFHGDAARTFLVGDVDPSIAALVRVTRECFFEALKVCRAGYRISDVARAVQSHAEAHGYGVVREMIGHGIGRRMHEPPDVPNYWDTRRFGHGLRLVEGMAIAIEPMINLGKPDIVQLSDGWTIEAADGLPSAHYENTVVITADGPLLTTLHAEVPA